MAERLSDEIDGPTLMSNPQSRFHIDECNGQDDVHSDNIDEKPEDMQIVLMDQLRSAEEGDNNRVCLMDTTASGYGYDALESILDGFYRQMRSKWDSNCTITTDILPSHYHYGTHESGMTLFDNIPIRGQYAFDTNSTSNSLLLPCNSNKCHGRTNKGVRDRSDSNVLEDPTDRKSMLSLSINLLDPQGAEIYSPCPARNNMLKDRVHTNSECFTDMFEKNTTTSESSHTNNNSPEVPSSTGYVLKRCFSLPHISNYSQSNTIDAKLIKYGRRRSQSLWNNTSLNDEFLEWMLSKLETSEPTFAEFFCAYREIMRPVLSLQKLFDMNAYDMDLQTEDPIDEHMCAEKREQMLQDITADIKNELNYVKELLKSLKTSSSEAKVIGYNKPSSQTSHSLCSSLPHDKTESIHTGNKQRQKQKEKQTQKQVSFSDYTINKTERHVKEETKSKLKQGTILKKPKSKDDVTQKQQKLKDATNSKKLKSKDDDTSKKQKVKDDEIKKEKKMKDDEIKKGKKLKDDEVKKEKKMKDGEVKKEPKLKDVEVKKEKKKNDEVKKEKNIKKTKDDEVKKERNLKDVEVKKEKKTKDDAIKKEKKLKDDTVLKGNKSKDDTTLKKQNIKNEDVLKKDKSKLKNNGVMTKQQSKENAMTGTKRQKPKEKPKETPKEKPKEKEKEKEKKKDIKDTKEIKDIKEIKDKEKKDIDKPSIRKQPSSNNISSSTFFQSQPTKEHIEQSKVCQVNAFNALFPYLEFLRHLKPLCIKLYVRTPQLAN